MAKIAPAAQSILDQADFWWPRRSHASDGTLGDARHRHLKSDHNPNSAGWVMAADLTNDPKHGLDAHSWAKWLAGTRDRRVKYIISNRKIWEPATGWRTYSGENPHTKHTHVSIKPGFERDTSPWFGGFASISFANPPAVKPTPAQPPPVVLPPVLTPVTGFSFLEDEEEKMPIYVRRPDGLISRIIDNTVTHLNAEEWALDLVLLKLSNKSPQVVQCTDAQWKTWCEGRLDTKAMNAAAQR